MKFYDLHVGAGANTAEEFAKMAERLRAHFEHHVCRLRKTARSPGLRGCNAGESSIAVLVG